MVENFPNKKYFVYVRISKFSLYGMRKNKNSTQKNNPPKNEMNSEKQ
jgi:hypothetical protein